MKKLSFTLVFCFLIILTSYSQRENGITFLSSGTLMKNGMLGIRDLTSKTNHSYNEWFNPETNSKVEGSMFLDDDFHLGSMILKSDTLVEGVKYRLNIFSKQMEMFFNNDTFALIHPEKIKNIDFDNKLFAYVGYEEDNKIDFDYFQVLAEGKCNLLMHYKVIIVPKNEPDTPLYTGSPNDKFVQFKYYFYQKGGNPANLLSKKSKSILKLFSDKKMEVDQYIKENNLKTSNDSDLVVIFQYYNSL